MSQILILVAKGLELEGSQTAIASNGSFIVGVGLKANRPCRLHIMWTISMPKTVCALGDLREDKKLALRQAA